MAGQAHVPFKKGADPRRNLKGRPLLGTSLAECIRGLVGPDGQKVAQLLAAGATWYSPPDDQTSSRTVVIERLRDFSKGLEPRDRIACAKLLLDHGWPPLKETIEHSGEVSVMTKVIHEYHKD